jgi:hypothetical protein
VLALRLRKCEAVLPALHKLCIGEPERVVPLAGGCSFIHPLAPALRPNIGVEYERVRINELRRTGTTLLQCQFITLIFWE